MMKENNCCKQSKGKKSDKIKTNPTSTSNWEKIWNTCHQKTTAGSGSQFEVQEMIKRMIPKEVAPLKRKIETLKVEVTEIRESQDLISARYDDINREFTRLLKDRNKQKSRYYKTNNFNQKFREEKLRRWRQNWSAWAIREKSKLRIRRTDISKRRGCLPTSHRCSKKIVRNLQKPDLSIAHHLPTKSGRDKNGPNTVVTRFVKSEVRNEIYYKRYLLQELNDDKHNNTQKGFYINENFTEKRKILFWQ